MGFADFILSVCFDISQFRDYYSYKKDTIDPQNSVTKKKSLSIIILFLAYLVIKIFL